MYFVNVSCACPFSVASHVGALGVAHLARKVLKVVPLVRDELLVEAEEAERVEVLGLHRFRRFRAKSSGYGARLGDEA